MFNVNNIMSFRINPNWYKDTHLKIIFGGGTKYNLQNPLRNSNELIKT